MATIPSIWVPYTVIDPLDGRFDYELEGVDIYSAYIPQGTYLTPQLFADALTVAIQTSNLPSAGGVGTVYPRSAGKFYVDWEGEAGEVYEQAAGSINAVFGFTKTATAFDYQPESDPEVQMQNYWTPGIPVSVDDYEQIKYTSDISTSLANFNKHTKFGSTIQREIEFMHLPIHKVVQSEEGTYINESFDRVWNGMKERFSYFSDNTSQTSYSSYFLIDPIDTLKHDRRDKHSPFYSLQLKFGKFVG